MTKIYSPVFRGSGAVIVHETLAQNMSDYEVKPVSPKWQYAPYMLYLFNRNSSGEIVHTLPDYAPFFYKPGSRLVVTFHNYVLDEEMQQNSTFLQRLHYRTDLRRNIKKALMIADTVTSVSQATADLVRDDLDYTGSIKVINNGIDTHKFRPHWQEKKEAVFKVFFSGNLNRRKGAHLLVQIADRIGENICIYYTSGLNKNNKLREHSRLKRLGRISHEKMPDIYRQMDLLLLPSVREGMNLAILEAMACGLPVVTSNCSSMPEQIIDGKGGYLCDPGNIESYAEKINSVANSSELPRTMGEFNRHRAITYFSLEKMIEEYRSLFHSLS